jgi:hypothetical protein
LVAIAWSAIAVWIGDSFDSPIVYGIVSGVIFVLVMGVGIYLLRRSGELEPEVDDLADDPVITGERTGLGAAALQVIGGLLAVPFVIYNFTLRMLDNLASLAPEQKPPENTDEKGIVPTEGSGD